ncbi:hypothetical protein [Marinobacterium arenosum]|uniref:hypothetical protein n=1 Tax=Marinobacterium arenosum TaxID=2862496 RepID=UPI001C96FB54|nr:hypothetical protein [Marinobacterium arenosum]MBY4675341.1 hypothetical protein [Marinobacterium arenosum]
MPISRFLVENHGSNPEAIKLAFAQALHNCKSSGLSKITLVFPTKGSFPSSNIAQFLGEKAAKALTKGSAVNLGDGIQLTLEIPKNIKSFGRYDVLLATYLTAKDMDVIDGVNNTNSILYLPWNEEEGKRWLSTWKPQVVGNQSWVASTNPLPQFVQDVVLKLGRCINMATGLSHPSDKEMAKKLFSELRKNGVTAPPELVRQFAVQSGWEPVRAQELAIFAAKYIG